MGILTGVLWEAPERVIRPGRRGAMRWFRGSQLESETSQTGVWPGKRDDDDKLQQVERVSYTLKNYKLSTLHAHSAHSARQIYFRYAVSQLSLVDREEITL